MIIGIDGACKWGGTPECVSCGVAFAITSDGDMFYKATVESAPSTSQRGELNGLLTALKIALTAPLDEDVLIVTDSEYLYNSVMLDWCFTWEANNWVGSTGSIVKNTDMWAQINECLRELNPDLQARVSLTWTKGHLLSSLSASAARHLMRVDTSGITLYSNVLALASRVSEKQRIVSEFNRKRVENDKPALPEEVALKLVVLNVTADLLAGYIKDTALAAGII